MSKSEVAQLVSVLNGDNYGTWYKAMKAYLMSQGHWAYADGTETAPLVPDDPEIDDHGNQRSATQEQKAVYKAAVTLWTEQTKIWTKANQQTLGTIILRCNSSIQEEYTNYNVAHEVWAKLESRYGQATPTSVYKDFKETLNIRIKPDQNPAQQFDRMSAAFQRLSSAKVRIPNSIQAMIALSALPQKWEVLVPVITQTIELDDLKLSDVCEAVVAQWQTEAARHGNQGKNKDNKSQNANKLSNVKRKRGDPSFSNQQQGNNQQQQQNGDKPRQRGKRGGKNKGKGKASDGHSHAHISHIADVASIAPPTTSTVAQMGPSGIQKRTITSPAPKERTPGPYKTLNKALDTADTEGVTPTIQTVKTLEQRITEQYMDGPWSKSTNYLSDDEGSDIVDMSEVPAGHEGQDDWDAFAAASPSYEPLDWGSDFEDAEACVPSSISSLHSIHQALVSPPPQRRPGLTDGSCNIAPRTYTLSSLICEHEIEFALCAKCKEKRATNAAFGPQWLLDSGASSHFTFDINDFIEYTPLKGNERTAVRTAAHTVYAEGTGAVLITHWENDEEVTTRLYPVLHISTLHVRLLSMGEFLQHDWVVRGNSQAIALCNSLTDTPYIT